MNADNRKLSLSYVKSLIYYPSPSGRGVGVRETARLLAPPPLTLTLSRRERGLIRCSLYLSAFICGFNSSSILSPRRVADSDALELAAAAVIQIDKRARHH